MSRRAIVLSVLLHALIVCLLLFGFDFSRRQVSPPAASTVVQAKAIDAAALDREVKQLKARDDAARAAAEKKTREAERKVREAEQKRQAEERRVAELKAEQERLKQSQDAERKRVEQARKQAEQVEREAQAKREDEARKQAEADQQAAERKKREAEDKKRQEAQRKDAERKRAEQQMQDEMAAEEAAAAQASADQSELSKYQVAIYNRVRQSWTLLPGMDGLSCTLRISLIPGGEVAGVEIVQSSGNATFDRQAENAVRKAAPLPVPQEPRLFQKMRSITFVFSPQS